MKHLFKNREEWHRIFSGIGIAFTAMLFVMGFAVFVIGGAKILRSWLETELNRQFFTNLRTVETAQNTQVSQPVIRPPSSIQFVAKPKTETVQQNISGFNESQGPSNELTLSSFSDIFSGVGWIDQSKTSMFHDRAVTAFTFPPVITARKIESSDIPPSFGKFVERGPNGEDVRCAGNKCFSQREFELLYNGNKLAIPAELSGKQLVNISIGNLDTLLILGAVTKREDGNYEGWGFYFNGKIFSKAFGGDGNPFISKYPGILGFGGTDSDWLAIYGAYEGIAYRIREGIEPTDISYFFRERVMVDGFQPVVLRTQTAGEQYGVSWYVFSLTPGNTKLIKLFQNKTDDIKGAIDITKLIEPLRNAPRASFVASKISESDVILDAKVLGISGLSEFWEIKDAGFDKSKPLEVVSANINNYPAELRKVKMSELDISASGGKIDFALSSDGLTWTPAALGEEISFNEGNRQRLLWRARFTPDNDPLITPFLDRIKLDYQVKFL